MRLERVGRLDEPSLCLRDDVVSFADGLERSLVSEALVDEPVPAAPGAAPNCGGMDTGRGLLDGWSDLGIGVGSETGGCGGSGCELAAVCEMGRSNSCPPIIPPCEGVTEPATPSSGTWFNCGAKDVGYAAMSNVYRPQSEQMSGPKGAAAERPTRRMSMGV